MWEKMIEKVVDVEAKASLQPPFRTRKIDFRCSKNHRSSVRRDKNDANWKHWDEDKDKELAKSYNSFSTNSQPQTRTSKKDKHYGTY